jgi:aspartokinase
MLFLKEYYPDFKENKDAVLVITGFIGSNDKHETTTLGRNGSNYTASLVNYINAEELQNLPCRWNLHC